jgi:hypothetical protein
MNEKLEIYIIIHTRFTTVYRISFILTRFRLGSLSIINTKHSRPVTKKVIELTNLEKMDTLL